jgi:hypothetical protein
MLQVENPIIITPTLSLRTIAILKKKIAWSMNGIIRDTW